MIDPPIYDREPQERDQYQPQPRPQLPFEIADELFIIAMVVLACARFAYKLVMVCRGGLGLYLLRPMWGRYWREREYKADQYAAALAQADELADFLEIHALIHDHPIPFIWLTDHTHPPTELRVDRLRAYAHTPRLAGINALPHAA
jgi:Zn-dependent protease with chaperone function